MSVFERMNPNLLSCFYFKESSDRMFRQPLHHHENFSELLLIAKGTLHLEHEGKNLAVKEGQIVCYQEGMWHKEESDHSQPFEAYYLGFRNVKLTGLPDNHLFPTQQGPVFSLYDNTGQYIRLFQQIIREKDSEALASTLLGDRLLSVLLIQLVRLIKGGQYARKAGPAEVIHEVERYISDHYFKPVTLHQLSRHVHISPYYLCRLFKKETGSSPIDYLKSYRMKVALRMLQTTDDSVQKISEQVGYQSLTHFHQVFKKATGKTPGEARKINGVRRN